jgi:2-amino-4-hydroxy-6-hydroxymethyldihydropteridine diphosphokinase
MAMIAYIGIGSNLGDRRGYIEKAIGQIGDSRDMRLVRRSSIYETEPVSDIPQGRYLNGVLEIETDLAAAKLLKRLRGIENRLGRTRRVKNGPRTIDLDILFFGDETVREASLTIPHPRLHERSFVLQGLNEIAPEFIHPALKVKIRDLYRRVSLHEGC